MEERKGHVDSLLAAAVLILFGLLILLARMGVISVALLWDIWPALLLVAGLFFLYDYFHSRSNT